MDTGKIEMLARNYLEVMEIKDPVKDFCSKSGDNCSLSADQETFLLLSQENMKIMQQKLAEAYAIIEWQRSKIWHQGVEIQDLLQKNQGFVNNLDLATERYVDLSKMKSMVEEDMEGTQHFDNEMEDLKHANIGLIDLVKEDDLSFEYENIKTVQETLESNQEEFLMDKWS